MKQWYSWNSNGDDYATVAGATAKESLFLTPHGRPASDVVAQLRIVQGEKGPLPLSDFPHTGLQQPRVLSSAAWRLLEPQLSASGHVTDATIAGVSGRYFLWYPTVVVDCLEESASQVFESLSGFRRVIKPVFSTEALPSGEPFVIKGFETQDVWVDAQFRKSILNSGLGGSEFRMTARAAHR